MKILFLSNLYPPFVRGGAEYLGSELVKEMSKQGYAVAVFTSVPWPALNSFRLDKRQEGAITVYRFWPINLYHYLNANKHNWLVRLAWQFINLFNIYSAHRLRQVMREFKPELVVSFNLMGLGFNLPKSIKSFGLDHIHILHDVQLLHPAGLIIWGQEKILNSSVAKIYQVINKFLWKDVSEVLSPSLWLLDLHKQKGFFKNAKFDVLLNPLLSEFKEVKKNTGDKILITYVGQVEEHKGIFWLIEIIKNLPADLLALFTLEILPTGQSGDLPKMATDIKFCSAIKLHNQPTQSEIDKIVAKSNLVIVPSLCYENSPIAITKAQMAGTAVLASRLGGIPELIKQAETGWLFEPGNKEEFTKLLTELIKNPEQLAKVGELAKSSVSANMLSKYTKHIVNLHISKREQKQLLK